MSMDSIAELQMDRLDRADAIRRARTAIRMARGGLRHLMEMSPQYATPELLAMANRIDALCMLRLSELEGVE